MRSILACPLTLNKSSSSGAMSIRLRLPIAALLALLALPQTASAHG